MGNGIRHLFTPHHSNNHHARVLHVDAMFVYLLAFVLFKFLLTLGHTQFPDVLGFATDIRVEQLFSAINAKRAEAGLGALVLDQRLSRAAALKAQDMFAKGYWAHNSPSGKTPWEFVTVAGYRYRVAGENLAKNFSVSSGVVDAWMASPTHRENIMRGDYKDIGFAVVNGVLAGEETTLVVQMFGAGDSQLAYQIKPTILTPTAAATAPSALVVVQPFATVAAQNNTFGLTDVLKQPLVDISSISKQVTTGFAGLILLVVVIDGWYVYRRKIIRVSGHSVGHMAFFAVLLLLLQLATRGAVL
ncbi:MAG: CAP domain-containing protein [Candidatus Gottesmanbacteria bacterium]|nr:CAP domain-containing protein [Candidatus Gottesmanbacteria bacterium]